MVCVPDPILEINTCAPLRVALYPGTAAVPFHTFFPSKVTTPSDGTPNVPFVPVGDCTESVKFVLLDVQDTVMAPWGVGMAPFAHARFPIWGITLNVENPGEVGMTPRT